MGKDARRSGAEPESRQITFSYTIHAFGPAPGERARGQQWTHIALQVGDYVWEQPWRGKGVLYSARPYFTEMLSHARMWGNFEVVIENEEIPFMTLMTLAKTIANRKGQPLRNWLRRKHLWPWPAWNEAGPVILMLDACGWKIKEETPDGLIKALVTAAETGERLGACEQDPIEGHK